MNAKAGASQEHKLAILLCLAAAVHVFVLSAAFPFFDNLDEPMHLDLVVKYSHGQVPRTLEPVSAESSVYLTVFSSYAYRNSPDEFPGHKMPPPLWTQNPDVMKQVLAATSAAWQKQINYESSQAPLYYVLGGCWWNFGKTVSFQNGRLLYWLRFLNTVLLAGVVWLGYTAAKMVFPQNSFLRLGVPALIAFMPQSAFYSVENDSLSALSFGLAFICLVRWLENPSGIWAAATGLSLAATYLTKTTNLPLLFAAFGAVLVKIWLDRKNIRAQFRPAILLLGCAGLPVAVWMLWCKNNFGDWTGSAIKIHFLGWTVKPVSQWLSHPIFTARGAWVFISGNINTFWQGEHAWHGHQLRLPGSDIAYTLISMVLVIAALVKIVPQYSKLVPSQQYALGSSIACVVTTFAFFGLMSVVYDFHNCPYPSKAYPYFASGRLLLGGLIPFLLLIVYGLDALLSRFGNITKFTVLAGLIAAMLSVEILTDWPVFANPYNWYHLP